jgi:YYY domain-containing protein
VSEWVLFALPGLAVFEVILVILGLHVFAFVLPLVLLASMLLLRGDTRPEQRFVALLMLTALAMTLVVEVITLKGDIGRMNTVFKFYLQGWVLFAVSGAVGLILIFERMVPNHTSFEIAQDANLLPSPARASGLKQAWWAALGLLLFAGLLYPVFATWAKVNDRFVADSPASLNGLDYMRSAVYNVNDKDLSLVQDYNAIQWLRENVKGSPVIAEASYELYRWNDRVSINTGLPTIVGWDWHTKQQYSLIDGSIVDQRKQDVADLYNTADPTQALQILQRYDVSYIYVGPLERALYDVAGLNKFEAMASSHVLSKVYDADGVQIYQINSSERALNR